MGYRRVWVFWDMVYKGVDCICPLRCTVSAVDYVACHGVNRKLDFCTHPSNNDTVYTTLRQPLKIILSIQPKYLASPLNPRLHLHHLRSPRATNNVISMVHHSTT